MDALRDDYDALIKLVVVGDKSVGKSSLVLRFCDDVFPEQYIATIGVDFSRSVHLVSCKFGTPLAKRDSRPSRKVTTEDLMWGYGVLCADRAQGAIIVYDCTDPVSFTNVQRWYDEVIPAALQGASIIVVASKCDLYKEGEGVDKRAAQQWALQHNVEWQEVSAKLNKNVEAVFATLAEKCSKSGNLKAGIQKSVVPVDGKDVVDKSTCC